jgi:hypothetical protein
MSITVPLYCYYVTTPELSDITENNLKKAFHDHFNFALDTNPDLFIDQVILPTKTTPYAEIQLTPCIPPPLAFCSWRYPLYFGGAQSVSKIINGTEYTMRLAPPKSTYVD